MGRKKTAKAAQKEKIVFDELTDAVIDECIEFFVKSDFTIHPVDIYNTIICDKHNLRISPEDTKILLDCMHKTAALPDEIWATLRTAYGNLFVNLSDSPTMEFCEDEEDDEFDDMGA